MSKDTAVDTAIKPKQHFSGKVVKTNIAGAIIDIGCRITRSDPHLPNSKESSKQSRRCTKSGSNGGCLGTACQERSN